LRAVSTYLLLTLLFISTAIISCRNKNTLFQPVSSVHSGIHFKNTVEEDDIHNVLEYMNIYTGG